MRRDFRTGVSGSLFSLREVLSKDRPDIVVFLDASSLKLPRSAKKNEGAQHQRRLGPEAGAPCPCQSRQTAARLNRSRPPA